MVRAFASILSVMAYVIIACMATAYAEQFSVSVQGRESVTVTNPIVILSDIADVRSRKIRDDESVLGLNKIEIATAPQPGDVLSISAHQVIEALKRGGVSLSDVGYTFPRIINIKRAARVVQVSEVQSAIEEYLKNHGEDATVRKIGFKQGFQVAPDALIGEITPISSRDIQKSEFIISFTSSTQAAAKLSVSATLDRWIAVAVTKRAIERGDVVNSADIVMARYNVHSIPADAINQTDKAIGFEVKRRLAAGEVLQRNTLAVPTVIRAGEKVTVRYRTSHIEATATGVSLDSAGIDQQIRVRNEASAKVVSGIVRASGLVEVQ